MRRNCSMTLSLRNILTNKLLLLSIPICISLIILGCSSKRSVKKDQLSYTLSDMSADETPDWVFDSSELGKKDTEYKYFVGEYDNVNKVLCRKGASADATEKVVAEISQEIDSIFANNVSNANGNVNAISNADIKHKIQSKLGGIENVTSYWEQKNYKKELGADIDKKVYSCYQAVKIKRSTIKEISDSITKPTLRLNNNKN